MKEFIFDLDGTIIFNNKILSRCLCEKFEDMIKLGHRLIFATARSIRGVKKVLPEFLYQHPVIFCNGAFAFHGMDLVYSCPIDSDLAKDIVRFLDENGLLYVVEFGDAYYHPKLEHEYFKVLRSEAQNELIHSISDIENRNIYKISILDMYQTKTEVLFGKKFNLSDNPIKVIYHNNSEIDIVNNCVSKWECYSNLFMYPPFSERFFFGNDENDLEMFSNIENSFQIKYCNSFQCKIKYSIDGKSPNDIEFEIQKIIKDLL